MLGGDQDSCIDFGVACASDLAAANFIAQPALAATQRDCRATVWSTRTSPPVPASSRKRRPRRLSVRPLSTTAAPPTTSKTLWTLADSHARTRYRRLQDERAPGGRPNPVVRAEPKAFGVEVRTTDLTRMPKAKDFLEWLK